MPHLRSTPGLVASMSMGAAAFGGWALLLPVVPLAISEAGGSDALAGGSTAIFMATTVLTQLGVPALVRKWGHVRVLAAGCFLLGVPALALIISVGPPMALGISAVRGIGFGLLTVAGAALIAELAPRSLLGRATGAQGIAVALAQMVTLPAGLTIAARWSTTPVFVLGACVPLFGVIALAFLPASLGVQPESAPPALTSDARGPILQGLIVPCLAVACVAAASGGVTSLLPIALPGSATLVAVALSVVSASMLIGRYSAGAVADRFGVGWALAPALGLSAVGMALFAVTVSNTESGPDSVVVLGAAAALGAGFGAVQNDTLVITFMAVDPSRFSAASAVWNISFDSGTGVGALLLGVIAASIGYTWGFGSAAVLILAMFLVSTAVLRRGSRSRLPG